MVDIEACRRERYCCQTASPPAGWKSGWVMMRRSHPSDVEERSVPDDMEAESGVRGAEDMETERPETPATTFIWKVHVLM